MLLIHRYNIRILNSETKKFQQQNETYANE